MSKESEYKPVIGINSTAEILTSAQCSCTQCDSISCFNCRNRKAKDQCPCNQCQHPDSCLLYENNMNNPDRSKSANITKEHVNKEVFYEFDNNARVQKITKQHSRYQYSYKNLPSSSPDIDATKNEQNYQKPPTQVHSLAVEYTRKDSNSATAKLSAQVMDVPYTDLKNLLSIKPSESSSFRDIPMSKYDIIKRIKDAYKSCSCKVCECITSAITKPINNEFCKCKPCECDDCAGYVNKMQLPKTNIMQSTKTCRGLFKIFNELQTCDCKPCDCIQCADTFIKYCDCEPCQCIECQSMAVHKPRTIVVAPVGEEHQRQPCRCTPCECINCGTANRLREMSTGTTRHINCDCENCVDDSCAINGADSCRCERQSRVMRKPVERDTHEYDIRRASILNLNSRDESKSKHDTIAMFAALPTVYTPFSANKTCNCDTCECLACDCAEVNTNRKTPQLILSLDKETENNCECSPCECEHKTSPKSQFATENSCECDICNCIDCRVKKFLYRDTNTLFSKNVKPDAKLLSKGDCECNMCECMNCENNMSNKYVTYEHKIHSKPIHSVKKEVLTPTYKDNIIHNHEKSKHQSVVRICSNSDTNIDRMPLPSHAHHPVPQRRSSGHKIRSFTNCLLRDIESFANKDDEVMRQSSNIMPDLNQNSEHSWETLYTLANEKLDNLCMLQTQAADIALENGINEINEFVNEISNQNSRYHIMDQLATGSYHNRKLCRERHEDINDEFYDQAQSSTTSKPHRYPQCCINPKCVHTCGDLRLYEEKPRSDNMRTLSGSKYRSVFENKSDKGDLMRNGNSWEKLSSQVCQKLNSYSNMKYSTTSTSNCNSSRDTLGNDTGRNKRGVWKHETFKPNNYIDESETSINYQKAQEILEEAKAYSRHLMNVLEKYEKANREFKSISQKLKQSYTSILKDDTYDNRRNQRSALLIRDYSNIDENIEENDITHDSSSRNVLKNTSSSNYGKVRVIRIPNKNTRYNAAEEPKTKNNSITKSKANKLALEKKDIQNISLRILNELCNRIYTLARKERQNKRQQNKQIKTTIQTKTIRRVVSVKSESVRQKIPVKPKDVTPDTSSSTLKENRERNQSTDNKSESTGQFNGLPQKNNSSKNGNKTTEHSESTRHYEETGTDVMEIEQPEQDLPMSLLQKNMYLNHDSNVTKKCVPSLPSLALDVKNAVGSISLQLTNPITNVEVLRHRENHAMAQLQIELKKILDMPILQTSSPKIDYTSAVLMAHSLSPYKSPHSGIRNTSDLSVCSQYNTEMECTKNKGDINRTVSLNTEEEFISRPANSASAYPNRTGLVNFNKSEDRKLSMASSISSCESMKASFLGVRRVSDHTILVKWNPPQVIDNVQGYELLVDGRAVQKMFSPSRCMAVVTCLPHCDKVLLTIRTVTATVSQAGHYPSSTIVYRPRAK